MSCKKMFGLLIAASAVTLGAASGTTGNDVKNKTAETAQKTTAAPAAQKTTAAPAAKKTTAAPAAQKTAAAPAAKKTAAAPAAKKTTAPAKKAPVPAVPTVTWRFFGPFRLKYTDNLRKTSLYCKNLNDVIAALKKNKYNWNPKKFKNVRFYRSKTGSTGYLEVTGTDADLRALQKALRKSFQNEIRVYANVLPALPAED